LGRADEAAGHVGHGQGNGVGLHACQDALSPPTAGADDDRRKRTQERGELADVQQLRRVELGGALRGPGPLAPGLLLLGLGSELGVGHAGEPSPRVIVDRIAEQLHQPLSAFAMTDNPLILRTITGQM